MGKDILLDRAALLLVDLQRDVLHADGALARAGFGASSAAEVEILVQACSELVATMRRAGRPVVWVTTELRADFADSALAQPWLERRRASDNTAQKQRKGHPPTHHANPHRQHPQEMIFAFSLRSSTSLS